MNYESQLKRCRLFDHPLFNFTLIIVFHVSFSRLQLWKETGAILKFLKIDIQKFNLNHGNQERVKRFLDLSSSFIPRGIGFLHIVSLQQNSIFQMNQAIGELSPTT
ncbi:unnamed protein product [Cuscuta epithymum]|uniref:Uncharacterized protein n=1 Tax=Cuscuta epithymum TaxID=186058 RepID=A0AAV0CN84_9ASTE|nr:unnamed protein product [Cuscuta epithymum]